MLHSTNSIINYKISAKDGEIGRCKDFLFDERFWAVRYMVLDTGKWLPGKKVVISPIALKEPDWKNSRFPVNLTKKEIEHGPLLEEHAPVSMEYEKEYFQYHSWPSYWGGNHIWGISPNPPAPPSNPLNISATGTPDTAEVTYEAGSEENHLRSTKEVTGYHVAATDDDCGHIEDFILDDVSWTIRYLAVDTRNWLPGRKVIMSPQWIKSIDWTENKITVDLKVKEIKEGPQYNPEEPVSREYERSLYDYYGKPCYWIE